MAALSEDFFIEEDFEAVLTIFCSYDYGANSSEAIEKMGTYEKDHHKCCLCFIAALKKIGY